MWMESRGLWNLRHSPALAAAEGLPWSIPLAGACLTLAGCAAIGRAEQLAGGLPGWQQQAVWAVLAAAVMAVVAGCHYRWARAWSYPLLALALLLLVAVLFFPPINGARRWIRLGSLGVQPSELARLALVLALARWLSCIGPPRHWRHLIVPTLFALMPAALILRQPDLGMALLLLPVLGAMLAAAGVRLRVLSLLVLCGALATPVVWTHSSREQRSRITAWLDQPAPGGAVGSDGYQLYQAKQALALGGVWGTWLAGHDEATHAAWHLPADRTDFVFAVLGERYGWWGLAAVLGLYGWLVTRIVQVSLGTRDPFARLAAVGIAATIAAQSLVNAGMTVGLLPITGVPLPLVSYGGSGLVVQGAALGLVLSIARNPHDALLDEPFQG